MRYKNRITGDIVYITRYDIGDTVGYYVRYYIDSEPLWYSEELLNSYYMPV